MARKFKSIYNHTPKPSVISSYSEVKRDESLTISQIISLHLRGMSTNLHVYPEVGYEVGLNDYSDEHLNEDYYELENDLSDFNSVVDTSGDFRNTQNEFSNTEPREKPSGDSTSTVAEPESQSTT